MHEQVRIVTIVKYDDLKYWPYFHESLLSLVERVSTRCFGGFKDSNPIWDSRHNDCYILPKGKIVFTPKYFALRKRCKMRTTNSLAFHLLVPVISFNWCGWRPNIRVSSWLILIWTPWTTKMNSVFLEVGKSLIYLFDLVIFLDNRLTYLWMRPEK